MTINLPPILRAYMDSCNRHDVPVILACFSKDAVVEDEGEKHHGREEIGRWITKTIAEYNFRLKPLKVKEEAHETIVTTEISGSFDGSPVLIEYCFTIRNELVQALRIE